MPQPVHAITVDLEDWYQSSVDSSAPITERVLINTDHLLELLDELNVKATFFVLGKVAEAFPGLIKRIHKLDHDIQSHGYGHIPLNRLNTSAFREDLSRSINVLESIVDHRITMYRAPDFSLVSNNPSVLDILTECGIKVDSSVFPMKTWRYGASNIPLNPYYLKAPNGKSLLEVPVAVWSLLGSHVPVAGGGYMRLLPYWIIRLGISAIEAQGRPAVIYCHPYEFSPGEARSYGSDVHPLFAEYQELGKRRFVHRLVRLLQEFQFGRLDHCLDNWG